MRYLLVICVCCSTAPAWAQDAVPQSTPTAVEAAILQSVEEKYSAEVAKAEADLAKIKQAAAAARLKAYKEKLIEITKSGDFDKAIAIKAKIEELETDPAAKPSKRPRPKGTVKFQGHTYALIKEAATWNVAKKRCEEMGGHLVCLETPKEAAFVGTLCGGLCAWIGATDEENEGSWTWVNGSTAPMPPNTEINGDNGLSHALNWFEGKWSDGTQGNRFAYVCEWDK